MSDNVIDMRPQSEGEADRASLDILVPPLDCNHSWVVTVCAMPGCGLVIGDAEMHPEER